MVARLLEVSGTGWLWSHWTGPDGSEVGLLYAVTLSVHPLLQELFLPKPCSTRCKPKAQMSPKNPEKMK